MAAEGDTIAKHSGAKCETTSPIKSYESFEGWKDCQGLKSAGVEGIVLPFRHVAIELFNCVSKGEGFRVKLGCHIKAGELLIREVSHLELVELHGADGRQALADKLRQQYARQLDTLFGDNDEHRIDANCWERRWSNAVDNALSCVEIAFDISKMNHSCTPNADRTDDDINCTTVSCTPKHRCSKHQTVYAEMSAISDILAGEEITVCYLSHWQLMAFSDAERRAELLRTWHFHCDCSRCRVHEFTDSFEGL